MKYAPTLDVAIVGYNEEELTYRDRSTGISQSYVRRTLNWVSPQYGCTGSCPVPERLADSVRRIGRASSMDTCNARLVLASFGYDKGVLHITLDAVEALVD